MNDAPLRGPAAAASGSFGMTEREIQILSAIVDGYTNRELARKLAVSEQTVKRHLTRIFDKAGVSSRLELALFAMNNKLVQEI